MKYIFAVLFTMVGFAQSNNSSCPFSSPISPRVNFESLELLPAAATQMCSGSTVSVTRTGGTVLSIGTGSSASAPQSFRFGQITRQLTAAVTATLTAGSATGTISIYAYLSGANVLTLGVLNPTSNTISCSGCTTAAPGTVIGQQIAAGILLWTWSLTTGAYDVSGGTQKQVGKNCQITGITITNGTGLAATITATDSQGTPVVWPFSATSIAANSAVAFEYSCGTFFEGGLKLTSGTASALTVKVTGGRSSQ